MAETARPTTDFRRLADFIWDIANLLRGDYKQADYGKVILPMTVLRRLDCVLEPTKEAVLKRAKELKGESAELRHQALKRTAKQAFYNTSRFDFQRLLDDPAQIGPNLIHYLNGFSKQAREILEHFGFEAQIEKLERSNLLYLIIQRFADVDLHPAVVPNEMMGSIFEELIRRFAEQSNETAGEHFTPREVIRLIVNLLFIEDDDVLRKPGVVKTLYDPAAGTGGMLSVAEDFLREMNPQARLEVFGQELNDESYAICKADMLIKGQNAENIVRGNSFSADGHGGRRFDYMLSNPPFGVSWKKVQKFIVDEHDGLGLAGRFGAGIPRINDGSFLFLQHMISKMRPPAQGGGRLAIVFNGSPLFSGDAGSGESEIRRWIIGQDWLEAIVALPDQLFYNTGIHTYVWIVTNRKSAERKGKVQLVNGVGFFRKMRSSLGNKRNELSSDHIRQITEIYGAFAESKYSKIFDNDDFGFRKITVERPLRLSFRASPERIARLEEEKAFKNLARSRKKGEAGRRAIEEGERSQVAIRSALHSMDPQRVYPDRQGFLRELKKLLDGSGAVVSASVRRAIVTALGARDDSASVCMSKGAPEPDTELRDNENVPLKDSVETYFDEEVKPYAPEAWLDTKRTKVGYSIPLTRYFYTYSEPRPLESIRTEIAEASAAIQGATEDVLA